MATATKSKLNSKLPSVSKIAFCTSAGKDMATKIYTGENRKFTRNVGFKQDSKAYPFQIQFRQRSRYTNENVKIKGAQWTAWSDWKAACSGGGINYGWTESDHPVDRWMKANKGINKNATYLTFQTHENYQFGSPYDAKEWQYRIRTFNKSQARHGNWCTQTLQIFARAEVRDETYITASDGGLKIKFNYRWDRTGTKSYVKSIKDGHGRQLLKSSYNGTIEVGYLSADTTPTPRSGYSGGMITVPLSKLKRRISAGETILPEIYFETADGARTMFTFGSVIDPHRDIPMTVATSWNESIGLLDVSATNDGSVPITSIGASATYTYNEKTYSIPPMKKEVSLEGTSHFYFYPPIGLPLTINVTEEDQEDYKDRETITFTGQAAGYRLNKDGDTSICGVAWGNPKWDMESAPQVITELPYGRESSVAFYGTGSATTINFTALLVDKPDMYAGEWARKKAWDKVRNNQGVYWFRTNVGDMYKVALTGTGMAHEDKDLYELSVKMEEVV